MQTYPTRLIHVSISRPWREVYDFAGNPSNMPRWASGLGAGMQPQGDDWIVDGGPIGKVRVRFAPANDFGVIDHTVTLPDGTQVYNALRVAPNGDGAEVIFTLLRMPGTSDETFEADARHVTQDLQTLKHLLEGGA